MVNVAEVPGETKIDGAGLTVTVYPGTFCGVIEYNVPPLTGVTVTFPFPVPVSSPGSICHVAVCKFEEIVIKEFAEPHSALDAALATFEKGEDPPEFTATILKYHSVPAVGTCTVVDPAVFTVAVSVNVPLAESPL